MQACLTETLFCRDEVSSYMFFDGLQPTRKVHSELALAILEAVTPAPFRAACRLHWAV
jgi:phospholipase/lecithinase/hemolysin